MLDFDLALMAIEPLPQGNWIEKSQTVLEGLGLNVARRRSELLIWGEGRQHGDKHYSDGYSLRRIWLSPGRSALGVLSKRIYLLGNGTEIDSRPERVVLSASSRPDPPRAVEVAKSQWALIGELVEGFQNLTKPIKLTQLDVALEESRQVQIAGSTYCSPPERLNKLYREHGFDRIPNGFTVSLCPLESVSEHIIYEFRARLERAAIQRHLNLAVKRTSSISVSQRLNNLTVSGESVRGGHCVLFVLPNKGQKPEGETLLLFEAMEKVGVPFRRAYANDSLEFSIPDQLPSLVIAAGGMPHRSPTEASGAPVWTVGVDLSHRVRRTTSVLAVTLVNPDGELVGGWMKRQELDETARVETISTLLSSCHMKLTTCESDARIVVLRDGRMFENEDSNLYRNILETDVSLFEYRKRGNPQIVFPKQPNFLPGGSIAATLPGASTMFVTTAAPRDERTLAAVAKITWRREWNGLGLEPTEIGKILAASATAPGLGLHSRHLPAAIYWADGIAGANDDDLRFRGIPTDWVD
jgi:hypothetical protein